MLDFADSKETEASWTFSKAGQKSSVLALVGASAALVTPSGEPWPFLSPMLSATMATTPTIRISAASPAIAQVSLLSLTDCLPAPPVRSTFPGPATGCGAPKPEVPDWCRRPDWCWDPAWRSEVRGMGKEWVGTG